MHGPRKLRRFAARDRRLQGHRPGQHRAEPRRVLPQLFWRAKTQSAAVVTSVLFGLRLGRWRMVGFSAAAAVSIFVQTAGFYQVAGQSAGDRAAFGASMATLAARFVALFPPPIRPDTVGGYVEFRGFHPVAILFAVWALASATGFARGDEERGIVEVALATGTSRIALVAARTAAFAVAICVASAAAGAAFVVGVASGGESVEAARVIEACALLAAVGLSCYALAMLVAQ